MISLFTPSLCNLSLSYLSISIPPSPNPPSCLLGQFEFLNIKNSSAFRKYDRTTGIWQDDRKEYDRTKDRQRTLGKYMIDVCFFIALFLSIFGSLFFSRVYSSLLSFSFFLSFFLSFFRSLSSSLFPLFYISVSVSFFLCISIAQVVLQINLPFANCQTS